MSFMLDRSNNQNNKIIMNFDSVEYNNQQQQSNQNKDRGNFINLPQRKRNYNVDEYYCKAMSRGNKTGGRGDGGVSGNVKRQRRKGPLLQDF